MITNLIFDLSGYGGSANFTAATTTDLINELNTLTGVTWYWDPADCKPKSNFYPGVPPVITTAYKVSFVDIDNDSVGFCNAGSLDYTKFTEIDLSGYGGSATTQITNATDIINAFAALTPSLTVSVSGCSIIIDNWDKNITYLNVEVKKNTLGCTITNAIMPGQKYYGTSIYEGGASVPFEYSFSFSIYDNPSGGNITVDYGDGTITVYTDPISGITHTYVAGNYTINIQYTDVNSNLVTITQYISVTAAGEVKFMKNNTTTAPYSFVISAPSLTSFSFDTTDCSGILYSLGILFQFSNVNIPATPQIELTFGGTTTILSGTIVNFTNIPFTSYTGAGTYPLIVKIFENGIEVGEFTSNVYIS